VDLTLFEMAAIGRTATKITVPATVVANRAGRITTASAATRAGSGSPPAKAGVAVAKPIVAAQIIARALVFISILMVLEASHEFPRTSNTSPANEYGRGSGERP
jgi:hypothetical protein